MAYYTPLLHRGLIRVSGQDRLPFLQGLITQDVMGITESHPAYGLFLTPQGRYLYDLFLIQDRESLLIDSESPEDLRQKLSRYRLRSHVTVEDDPSLHVFAVWGEDMVLPQAQWVDGLHLYQDPRFPGLGGRAIASLDQGVTALQRLGFQEKPFEAWDQFRLQLGIPDGSRDMMSEKAIPLECGIQDLHGISWEKGCYIGQELTARTHYRGLVRKRLLPVTITGDVIPTSDTPICQGDHNVGEMRSHTTPFGLALLRLESLHKPDEPLRWGDCLLHATVPTWGSISAAQDANPCPKAYIKPLDNSPE